MITVNDIKKFHQSYNRLTLFDHVILLIVSESSPVSINDIYMAVFKRYRQITKAELFPLVRKLAKMDLIRFDYYIGQYILTKTGTEELNFVEEFVKQKK